MCGTTYDNAYCGGIEMIMIRKNVARCKQTAEHLQDEMRKGRMIACRCKKLVQSAVGCSFIRRAWHFCQPQRTRHIRRNGKDEVEQFESRRAAIGASC